MITYIQDIPTQCVGGVYQKLLPKFRAARDFRHPCHKQAVLGRRRYAILDCRSRRPDLRLLWGQP